jgi:hypothetical protein
VYTELGEVFQTIPSPSTLELVAVPQNRRMRKWSLLTYANLACWGHGMVVGHICMDGIRLRPWVLSVSFTRYCLHASGTHCSHHAFPQLPGKLMVSTYWNTPLISHFRVKVGHWRATFLMYIVIYLRFITIIVSTSPALPFPPHYFPPLLHPLLPALNSAVLLEGYFSWWSRVPIHRHTCSRQGILHRPLAS